MAGNVWEWVEDCWNGSYVGSPGDGRAWLSGDCSRRVGRGGSWDSVPWSARPALRYWVDIGHRHFVVGFRVVRALEERKVDEAPSLDERRKAEEESRRVEAEIKWLLAEAERAIAARNWAAAERALAQARRLKPDRAETAALEAKLKAAKAESVKPPATVPRDAQRGNVPKVPESAMPKPPEAHIEWYVKAAEADNAEAQYALGRLYEQGIGVQRDAATALKWYLLAAEQAHREATKRVEDTSASLPRDIQERATELVAEHYRRFRRGQ